MSLALNALKGTANLLVSIGSSTIISNAIKATTPADLKRYQKITVTAGSIALSMMVSDAASRYSDKTIDQMAEQVKEASDQIKKNLADAQNKDVVSGETVEDNDEDTK